MDIIHKYFVFSFLPLHIYRSLNTNQQELTKFKQQINKVHSSIKFDFDFSNKEINFVDTAVYKRQLGKLEYKLYRKESDGQAYLHRKSEHPESLKRSISFAKALRLCRIYSKMNSRIVVINYVTS